jgi:hypothetical protein
MAIDLGTLAAWKASTMGTIEILRRPGVVQSCVVGDHVYLKLHRHELDTVCDALHLAGSFALAQQLRIILEQLADDRESETIVKAHFCREGSAP